MADSSRNPQDQAEMRKLEATLARMNEQLAAARAQGDALIAKSDAVESRLAAIEQRTAKGELGAAEKLPRAAPRASEEAPAVRGNAQAAEQRAAAEERATKATAERVRLGKAPLQLGPGQTQLPRTQPEPFPPQYNRLGGLLSEQQRAVRERAASREAELAAQRQGVVSDFARPQGSAREALGSRRVGDLEKSGSAAQTAARGEKAFADSTAYSSRVLGQNANAIARNGALTTEFFVAAAKGQVTMRQLGEQVGLTIAKFGGWTTAAAAVYGAIGAIRELGAGAIQSETGVQRLLRFLDPHQLNKERAQQGFRDASREINVPIEDVAQGQAGFLRVYKDQDQALLGARVALKATKLDNIAAADSVRYFTAIAQEFQLPVSRLPLLLDQVANGYRELGANANDTVPALARSAAAVSNAGGSLTELVQITVAMRRLTGQTGLSIGTALSRSASNFVVKPANQAIIQGFGIDPKEGYTKLLRDAIGKSKSLSGDDIRKLATAIGGPQFGAKLFTALLRDRGNIVERAGIAVAPKAAKGKADQELKTVLSQADEEIGKVANNLQRLGSALAASGALNDIIALVKLLNLTLDSTTRLIELFSRLAGPLAQPLFMLGEMYGVLRLLRRFDLGRYLPGAGAKEGEGTAAANFFRQPLGKRTNAQIEQGLGYEKEAIQADVVSSSTAARRATRLRRAAEAEAGVAEGVETEEQAVLAAREKEATALKAQQLAIDEQTALATQTTNYQRLYGKRSSVLYRDAEGAAVASGIAYRSKDLEQGGAPVPIRGGSNTGAGARAGAAAAGETEAAAAAGAAALGGVRQKIDITDKELGKFASEGKASTSTFTKLKTVAGEGAAATVGLYGSVKATATRLAEIKAGPMSALIAAFIGFEVVQHIVETSMKNTEQQINRMEKARSTADPAKLRAAAQQTLEGRGGLHGLLDSLQNTAADFSNATSPDKGHQSPEQVRLAEAHNAQREAASLEQAQGRGTLLGTAQIRANLDARLKASHNAKESLAAIDQAYKEMGTSYAATLGGKGDKDALAQLRLDVQVKAADIKAGTKDLNAIVEALTDAATVKTFAGETSTRLEQHGPTKGNLLRVAAEIARIEELSVGASGKELKDLGQLQKQVEDEAVTAIQKQAQGITTYAGTPQEFHAAVQVEIAKLRQTLVGGTETRLRAVDKRTKERGAQIDAAEKAAAAAAKKAAGIPRTGAFGPLGAVGIAGTGAGEANALRADADKKQRQLDALEKAQSKDKKLRQQLIDDRKRDEAKLRPLVLEEQKKDFQFQQQEFSAQTELLNAQTADPLVQARQTAARLHQQADQVAVAYRRHLVSHAELLTAIANADKADQQAAQADVSRFQAFQGLATSRFALANQDQGAILRNSIATAQQFLGKVRSLGSKLDPATAINAAKAVVDAQIAYRDYVQAQAKAMLTASENLAKAGLEDPVQVAAITAHYAKLALQKAKKDGDPVAIREAQAKYKQARHDEAKARQQDAYDTIEFDLSMGTIDQQTAIARLDALEKTVKGNKAFRRQIELEKHRLQQELDNTTKYDIDIGNIRLPTTYELRRLITGGSQGVTVTNRNVVQVTVNDQNAVPAVARALEDYVSTGGSTARAMGLR